MIVAQFLRARFCEWSTTRLSQLRRARTVRIAADRNFLAVCRACIPPFAKTGHQLFVTTALVADGPTGTLRTTTANFT